MAASGNYWHVRILTPVVLIRLRPPGYQVDLWLFFRNGNVGTAERVGRDAVRVSGAEPERLVEALALWQARNQSAEVRVSDDD
jgi:hypothetical protein